MKRVFLIIQIVILTIFVTSGNDDVKTGMGNVNALPSQVQIQPYYSQLTQSGNRYTENHIWLKNGNGHIQVGVSYDWVRVIGDGIIFISPNLAVDDVFYKGDLLAEIDGLTGKSELRAPCQGIIKGINPMIEHPTEMIPTQVWVYKCELKRDQLGPLMDDQEYAKFIE